MQEKECTECKEMIPLIHFRRHNATEDGYVHVCKMCSNDIRIRNAFEREQEEALNEKERNKISSVFNKWISGGFNARVT
jgi:protein-arginine kinase activator protein McsA